ncbi:hypothetical protein BKA66DRAFT_297765, partial [Pyrenochaeta sp. MPI-SDFR-AT-0127]
HSLLQTGGSNLTSFQRRYRLFGTLQCLHYKTLCAARPIPFGRFDQFLAHISGTLGCCCSFAVPCVLLLSSLSLCVLCSLCSLSACPLLALDPKGPAAHHYSYSSYCSYHSSSSLDKPRNQSIPAIDLDLPHSLALVLCILLCIYLCLFVLSCSRRAKLRRAFPQATHQRLPPVCNKKELPARPPISESKLPPRLPFSRPPRPRPRCPQQAPHSHPTTTAVQPTPRRLPRPRRQHVHQGRTQIWLRPRNHRKGPLRHVENSALRRLQHQDGQARRKV